MKKEPLGVIFELFSDSLNMKRLSSDLVLFTLVKLFEENIYWAIFYLFFGLIKLLYEKWTERVLFKCFSYSLNMKILSSDLVLITLVKVFEENVCWAIVYLFLGLIRLLYEKGTERVLFKFFSNSLNMKNPWFFSL